jgi:hypothetical protein
MESRKIKKAMNQLKSLVYKYSISANTFFSLVFFSIFYFFSFRNTIFLFDQGLISRLLQKKVFDVCAYCVLLNLLSVFFLELFFINQNMTSHETRTFTTRNKSAASDQNDLKKLKSKYSAKLPTLKVLFSDWSDDDLLFVLEEANGDLDITIDRISEGITNTPPLLLISP